MVTPAVEAAAAEAAFWLHDELRRNSGWLRRKWRERALRRYLAAVVKAHLDALIAEPFLPGEQEAEERLATAIEHAIQEAAHPDVEAAAARYDAELARWWRAGYKLELARRWAEWTRMPIHSCMTPEADAYDQQARAEWEELARRREAEREQEAERAVPAERGEAEVAEPPAEGDASKAAEVERRRRLLREYTEATGCSEYQIYETATKLKLHSCYKPQFREWKNGKLPADSVTAQSLERFLAEKKAPSAKKSKSSPR